MWGWTTCGGALDVSSLDFLGCGVLRLPFVASPSQGKLELHLLQEQLLASHTASPLDSWARLAGMLNTARSRLGDDVSDRVQLIQSSVCNLPFKAESHDAVMACAVSTRAW
eukprot:5282719-Amphidinium_carterae.1